MNERLEILMTGQVQGVGFRPHVYQIATKLGLSGWVQNNASGVLMEIQGHSLDAFIAQLMATLPPLAKVNEIKTKKIPLVNEATGFEILSSQEGTVRTLISPDTAICKLCLQELFDPSSRFYLYPFLNCTNCGPRLTITRALPYDRCQTSMKDFLFCPECAKEYHDPDNRRYHAQPTSCAQCGPHYDASVEEMVNCIQNGDILALKGQGGYQLICDARNHETVQRLRERKNRESKPFAIMGLNIPSLKNIVQLDPDSENLLTRQERPIVLIPKILKDASIAIAPGLSDYGVMLPYMPIHYLLFHALLGCPNGYDWLREANDCILVVTSANPGGDPIVIENDAAKKELASIADKIFSYNREIVCRADDSVIRIIGNIPRFIRRARGYVPASMPLPQEMPSTLAVGGHLKNTFCITRGKEAFISQYIGSLNNRATLDFFQETLQHFLRFLDIQPARIAHDCHPDFYTTQFAEGYGLPCYPVQHHHAHLAAVAAEHHLPGPAIGLALDGYGYGMDGTAWGGELMLLENTDFERLGSFYPLSQPGGEKASREPWRMAATVMQLLGRGPEIAHHFREFPEAHFVEEILTKRIHCPMTTSCGRWFDAASAILDINLVSGFEAQAAMQLEGLVTCPEVLPEGWRIDENHFNLLPTLEQLFNSDPVQGANLFHGTLIAGLLDWLHQTAEKKGVDVVLLGGGCFLNKVLTEGLLQGLRRMGLKPYLSEQLPSNDGGISFGQAWIAGRRE